MLKRSIQKNYFLKRSKSFRIHLKRFGKSHDPQELHQLRVEVKKMRALLFLQQKSFKSSKILSSFEPIEKVFRKAGKIRCADVSLKLLKHFGIRDEKIKTELQEIIRKETKRFIKKTDVFFEKLFTSEKTVPGKFQDISIGQIKKTVEGQLEILKKEFLKNLKPELLHDVRKILKNLLYIHELFSMEITNELRLNTFYILEIETLIGNWHDLDDTIELIKGQGHFKKNLLKLRSKRKDQLKRIYLLTENFERRIYLGKSLNH